MAGELPLVVSLLRCFPTLHCTSKQITYERLVFKQYFLVIQKANASYFVAKLGRFSNWAAGT